MGVQGDPSIGDPRANQCHEHEEHDANHDGREGFASGCQIELLAMIDSQRSPLWDGEHFQRQSKYKDEDSDPAKKDAYSYKGTYKVPVMMDLCLTGCVHYVDSLFWCYVRRSGKS